MFWCVPKQEFQQDMQDKTSSDYGISTNPYTDCYFRRGNTTLIENTRSRADKRYGGQDIATPALQSSPLSIFILWFFSHHNSWNKSKIVIGISGYCKITLIQGSKVDKKYLESSVHGWNVYETQWLVLNRSATKWLIAEFYQLDFRLPYILLWMPSARRKQHYGLGYMRLRWQQQGMKGSIIFLLHQRNFNSIFSN